ncbi:MAG: hypothetical protein ACT4QF_00415 [Sporichthyaceae bacterium]
MTEFAETDLRRFFLGAAEFAVVGAVIGAALLWGGAPKAAEANAPTSAQVSVAR